MLAIRLKRFGKTHFATYRVVVQDSAKHPSSGKVVAYVGNYNPHTKEANLDKEQIEKYLSNGAQPSPRVVKLLKEAKIKLPAWVKEPNLAKTRTTRNPDKLRKNQPEHPAEEATPVAEPEVPTEPAKAEEVLPTAEPATEEVSAVEEDSAEPTETPDK
jgi:small subunit ribosomal protein S16